MCLIPLGTLPAQQGPGAPLSAWDEIAAQAEKDPPTGYSHAKAALANRPKWQAYYAKFAGWKATPPVAAEGRLRGLTGTPREPRFALTPKVWPGKPGEASVCLWEDDKVAAASFSIDDNNASDVASWEQISAKYGGLIITWFLITSNIGGTLDPGRISSAGKWEMWQRLRDAGYEIGSHSVTHVGNPVIEDGWPGPDWECEVSQQQLDAGLTGQKTKIFARPGSATKAFNMSATWRPSIEKYYAAARGGSGVPINQANMIDYYDIRTTANPLAMVSEEPQKDGWHLGDILKPESKYYRGWATVFIHNINGGPDLENNPNPVTAAFAKVFDFYHKNREDVWIGRLGDVALYGQERDTARLTTEKSSDGEIVLGLTSKMDPAIFDYPLTLKVRLPEAWKGLKAAQGGRALAVSQLSHEGGNYALVKAVPDAGEIRLTPES